MTKSVGHLRSARIVIRMGPASYRVQQISGRKGQICSVLFFCLAHHFARIFYRISEFSCRVAVYVVAVSIEDCNLIILLFLGTQYTWRHC